MKTLSPAKEKAMLKTLLKDRSKEFAKNITLFQKGKIDQSYEPALAACRSLKGFNSMFTPFFLKPVTQELTNTIDQTESLLEKVKMQRAFRQLTTQLAKAGMKERVSGFSELVSDIQNYADKNIKKMAAEIKHVKTKKISKLADQLHSNCSGVIPHLMKTLNRDRKELFDQVVRMIQTSRREELDELWIEVGEFCALLELAVESGFQKGKRLLQTLEVLYERLEDVRTEELFRQYIEELEKEREKHHETVRDVQLIRMLKIQLGISQATAIQSLHAQLPPALQLLKRNLSWTF